VDLDLQEFTVVGAGERSEGKAAVRTGLVVAVEVAVCGDGRKVRLIAARWAGSSGLLPASPWRLSRRLGLGIRVGLVGRRLGLAAEELLFEESVLGLALGEALLEVGLALAGPLVHGLVEVGLLAEVDGLKSMGAGGR
jgi:hypothetical protein